MNHAAIYKLYPNVVTIDDTLGALDKDGNVVVTNGANIKAEAEVLKVEKQHADSDELAMQEEIINKLCFWVNTRMTEEEAEYVRKTIFPS